MNNYHEVRSCSLAYALIVNLFNAAKHHKKNCDKNCNVSLFQMKQAANLIWSQAANLIWSNNTILNDEESQAILKMLDEWPN